MRMYFMFSLTGELSLTAVGNDASISGRSEGGAKVSVNWKHQSRGNKCKQTNCTSVRNRE